MPRSAFLRAAALAAAAVAGQAMRSTIALGPSSVGSGLAGPLPRVELQVNNTATQADDYAHAGAATPARVRLLNPGDMSAAVPITLKNLDFQAGPDLVFGAAAATSPTLDLTLPTDGAWVSFVVAGETANASTRDKDAIIEIVERAPDGVALGRKALMVAPSTPIGPPPWRVEIEIGNSAETIDDYVTWRPIPARIRFAAAPGGGSDVPVIVRNMSPTPATAGRLVFAAPPAAPAPTLRLTLPRNGAWVDFFVAGEFGRPSTNDKDAVLEVARVAGNRILGREGLMVRVRRNANLLTTNERDRFLNAIAQINVSLGSYLVHQQIHAVTSSQGHGGPAFLAWHRPYILRYERELQAIDPSTALHYWRFDEAAPAVFTTGFMGGPPSGGQATFAATNPLANWSIEAFTGIPRNPAFTPAQSPTAFGIRTETATFALGGAGSLYAAFRNMEGNPHGNIHGLTGGGGWIGSVPTAARDPLFFMLHSNVDRLWAKWQWLYGRDDETVTSSYDPLGAYAAPCSFPRRLGQNASDNMWPWDGTTGFVTPGDPCTQRPSVAPGGALPPAVGGWGPPPIPKPHDVVDYDRWRLAGAGGLGYAYDDVPFAQAGPP